MEITVHLPDDLTQHPDPAREVLEAFAIEGYRASTLSHAQASQILGLTRLAAPTSRLSGVPLDCLVA